MITGIESAKLKLIRASEHIKAIKNSIAAYSASEPCKIVLQADGEEQINIIHGPPASISILAGEILYQIRSALDHLVFDLVKLNSQGIRLPRGWDKRCEFPLFVEVPTRGDPPIAYDVPVPYEVIAKNLPGITKQAYTFIETLQPYNIRGHWILGSLNTMEAIAKLSNIDKHRHLNLTVPRTRNHEHIRFDTGTERGSWSILNNQAKLEPIIGTEHPMGRAMNVERTFSAIVTFDESVLSKTAKMPIELVLDFCAYTVETVIVPAFEKFIQQP